jgi:tetratricopeptide (TPR) repeat protein
MNGISRLDQLLQFLQQDPHDPFTIYALALEYRKTDPLTAKKYFDQLIADFPAYLATYYHAGMLWLELGLTKEAEELYRKGMGIAQKTGKTKDYNELQNALNNLLNIDNE